MRTTKLHLIAYISDARVGDRDVDEAIDTIVSIAKKENKKHHITGVLFYEQGRFLQVIEGNEESLRQLMANIENDNRHGNVTYLVDEQTYTRGFKKWHMAGFKLGRNQVFDAATLSELTESFKQNLLPRSDMLVRYYKALLKERAK